MSDKKGNYGDVCRRQTDRIHYTSSRIVDHAKGKKDQLENYVGEELNTEIGWLRTCVVMGMVPRRN